jgi:hypothetical protein
MRTDFVNANHTSVLGDSIKLVIQFEDSKIQFEDSKI